jgi:hypothetical protein
MRPGCTVFEDRGRRGLAEKALWRGTVPPLFTELIWEMRRNRGGNV